MGEGGWIFFARVKRYGHKDTSPNIKLPNHSFFLGFFVFLDPFDHQFVK